LVVAKPRRITCRPAFSTTQTLATPQSSTDVRTNDTYNQGDGIVHAVVIMKTSKGVPTAWEALTGRAEGVGSLRRFGERCIVQVPRETRKKADFTEMKASRAFSFRPKASAGESS